MADRISVQFEDNSEHVKEELERIALNWLEEASSEIESETIRRSRRSTGDTANKWTHKVDKDKFTAYVGNPLENAIWEEFGTGEYALKDNGRKGGWVYRDEKTGKFYHTYGKKPVRMLHNAFTVKKSKVQDAYKQALREMR